MAAKDGHDKVVQVVLEASLQHEINVNTFDIENKTPFTIACMNGHLEVAKLMIYQSRAYQIDLNLLDFQGNSAIHFALKNAHPDIVRLIFDEAKDKNIFLNQEGDLKREGFIVIFDKVNTKGSLVFGRRPELWNPMKITSALFVFPYSIVFHYIFVILMMITYSLIRWSIHFLFHVTVSQEQCYYYGFIDWLEDFIRPQCTKPELEVLKIQLLRLIIVLLTNLFFIFLYNRLHAIAIIETLTAIITSVLTMSIFFQFGLFPIFFVSVALSIFSTFLITKSKTIWKMQYYFICSILTQ